MGKPYDQEMSKLPDTYQWALTQPIEDLKKFVGNSVNSSLLAIGSGGSFTVAQLAIKLHEQTGYLSKAMTPLELITSDIDFFDMNILIPSASGRNPDIINAFNFSAKKEPKQLIAICLRKGSELQSISQNFFNSQFVEYDNPLGKDGFLATNTQIAFCTILCRAYEHVLGLKNRLSENIPELKSNSEKFENISEVLSKESIIVLYGKWGTPAAYDIESKFSEAALGCIQLTDYRNFGHGRHYWLEAKKENTGIIALVTPEEEKLAKKTLSLVPKNIPVTFIKTQQSGHVGSFDLIVKVLLFVNETGKIKKIDPGRPIVPEFGRKLYRLNLSSYLKSGEKTNRNNDKIYLAIKRKFGKIVDIDEEFFEAQKQPYLKYLETLEKNVYHSIIFDYDGTLCDLKDRFDGIKPEIERELTRLLKNGIIIGIATGRGISVRKDLRKKISKKYWDSVIIGYYNCSDIGLLSDDKHPNKNSKNDDSLKIVKDFFEKNQFGNIFKIEPRPKQITLEPISPIFTKLTERIIFNFIQKNALTGIQVLESKHTFDIIARDVSKNNLIKLCQDASSMKNCDAKVLCIGDQGEWPGNDFWLLSNPDSLSVDKVSPDLLSCWNLSQPGYINAQATLDYLKSFIICDGYFKFARNSRKSNEFRVG